MKEYNKCLRCGRKLNSEESKQRGFGNTCWEKYKSSISYKELFTLVSEDSTIVDMHGASDISNNSNKTSIS